MTRSRFSASSYSVSSTFMIQLVNGTQFFNASCVAGDAMIIISPLTKI